MHLEERFVLPQPGMLQSRSHEGLLLFPHLRGDALGSALWSADGKKFSEVKLAGKMLGKTPVLSAACERPGQRPTLPSGHALFFDNRTLLALEVCAKPTFTAVPWEAPGGNSFVRHDVHRDDEGRWWVAGHESRDEVLGVLFTSADGKKWTQVPGKFDGLKRLIPTKHGLRALGWKHVYAVTEREVTKLFSMRRHLDDALFTEKVTLAIGEGELGTLPAGGKKSKYQPCPGASRRVLFAEDARGDLWLGTASGLWHSTDGVSWSETPLREQVEGLHVIDGGLLVHTIRAVHAVAR